MTATAPTAGRRTPPWRGRALRGVGAAAATLLLVIVASWFLPGAATGPALVTSVGRAYDSTFTGCTAEREGMRTCAVTGAQGSASDHVDVRLRGRCWTATRVYLGGSQPPAPARGSGCIRLADNLRLLDRVLFGDPVDDLPSLLRDPSGGSPSGGASSPASQPARDLGLSDEQYLFVARCALPERARAVRELFGLRADRLEEVAGGSTVRVVGRDGRCVPQEPVDHRAPVVLGRVNVVLEDGAVIWAGRY